MQSRREHIISAAAILFRKKGFAATSMQEIADAVGIKAASLYNHISSKQEILSTLLQPISLAFSQGMIDIENSSLSPMEKLESLVSLHVNLTCTNKDRMALVTGEWVHLDAADKTAYLERRSQYEQSFLTILKACKSDGLIDHHTHVEIALYTVLSSLHWLYSWQSKHPEVSQVELKHQLKTCLLKGILK